MRICLHIQYTIYTQIHTVGLLWIYRRLREGSLARKWLLEGSTKAGGEVEGCNIPKSSRHTHGACAKRCCNTTGQPLVKEAYRKDIHAYNKITRLKNGLHPLLHFILKIMTRFYRTHLLIKCDVTQELAQKA